MARGRHDFVVENSSGSVQVPFYSINQHCGRVHNRAHGCVLCAMCYQHALWNRAHCACCRVLGKGLCPSELLRTPHDYE